MGSFLKLMITAYRVFNSIYTSSWSDGEGSFRYGGRWNSRGQRVLYASASLALATLEMLVHIDDEVILDDYSFGEVTFSEELILSVEDLIRLPTNWRKIPAPDEICKIGDTWITGGESVVLRVPTAILPRESNYIINLSHVDIDKVIFGKSERFIFDKRLGFRTV